MGVQVRTEAVQLWRAQPVIYMLLPAPVDIGGFILNGLKIKTAAPFAGQVPLKDRSHWQPEQQKETRQ